MHNLALPLLSSIVCCGASLSVQKHWQSGTAGVILLAAMLAAHGCLRYRLQQAAPGTRLVHRCLPHRTSADAGELLHWMLP